MPLILARSMRMTKGEMSGWSALAYVSLTNITHCTRAVVEAGSL